MGKIYGKKDSWLFLKKWNKVFLTLPKRDAGELIKGMCAFNEGEEYIFESVVLEALFEIITESEA